MICAANGVTSQLTQLTNQWLLMFLQTLLITNYQMYITNLRSRLSEICTVNKIYKTKFTLQKLTNRAIKLKKCPYTSNLLSAYAEDAILISPPSSPSVNSMTLTSILSNQFRTCYMYFMYRFF